MLLANIALWQYNEKKLKIIFFASCLGLIIAVTLLNSEYFFSQLQAYLGTFNSIRLGDTLISKPGNWVVVYKKDEQDSYGFSYGYIPYKLSIKPHCLTFFIVKTLNANNEIIFCQMYSDSVAKSKAALIKILDNPNNNFKVIKVNGFYGLVSNFDQNNFLIDFPLLGISIATKDVDDLSRFNFKKVDDANMSTR